MAIPEQKRVDAQAKKLMAQRKRDSTDSSGNTYTSQYRRVFVFLITWEETDSIKRESSLAELEIAFKQYKFDVLQYCISIEGSEDAVKSLLDQYKHYFDDPSSLLIVYYRGHSGLRGGDKKFTWSAWNV
jgi:hypothetical protein